MAESGALRARVRRLGLAPARGPTTAQDALALATHPQPEQVVAALQAELLHAPYPEAYTGLLHALGGGLPSGPRLVGALLRRCVAGAAYPEAAQVWARSLLHDLDQDTTAGKHAHHTEGTEATTPRGSQGRAARVLDLLAGLLAGTLSLRDAVARHCSEPQVEADEIKRSRRELVGHHMYRLACPLVVDAWAAAVLAAGGRLPAEYGAPRALSPFAAALLFGTVNAAAVGALAYTRRAAAGQGSQGPAPSPLAFLSRPGGVLPAREQEQGGVPAEALHVFGVLGEGHRALCLLELLSLVSLCPPPLWDRLVLAVAAFWAFYAAAWQDGAAWDVDERGPAPLLPEVQLLVRLWLLAHRRDATLPRARGSILPHLLLSSNGLGRHAHAHRATDSPRTPVAATPNSGIAAGFAAALQPVLLACSAPRGTHHSV